MSKNSRGTCDEMRGKGLEKLEAQLRRLKVLEAKIAEVNKILSNFPSSWDGLNHLSGKRDETVNWIVDHDLLMKSINSSDSELKKLFEELSRT